MPDLIPGAAEQQPAASPSIRDSIDAARTATPAGAEPIIPASATPASDTPKIDATGRVHGADGKFATKDGDPAPSKAPDAVQADPAAKAAPDPTKPTAAAPDAPAAPLDPVDPPAHWSKEDREQFAKAPPDIQRWLYKARARLIDGEFTQKSQALAEKYKPFEPILSVIDQRKDAWARNGLNPAQAFQQLIAYSDYATRDPLNFAREILTARGIDPATAFGGHAAPNPDGTPTPTGQPSQEVTELRNHITQLTNYVNQLGGQVTQRFQSEEQRVNQDAANQISQFRDAVDSTGAPSHPHFDKLLPTIHALIDKGTAADLQSAYDMAVWGHPETRESILAARARKDQEEQRTKDQAKVAAALRAGSSINGSPSGSVVVPPNMGIRETIDYVRSAGAGRV